jgi:hypothetical protein
MELTPKLLKKKKICIVQISDDTFKNMLKTMRKLKAG